jgi:hypothetical protein
MVVCFNYVCVHVYMFVCVHDVTCVYVRTCVLMCVFAAGLFRLVRVGKA